MRLSWIRRARRDGDAWEPAEIPLDEPEAYAVTVFSGDRPSGARSGPRPRTSSTPTRRRISAGRRPASTWPWRRSARRSPAAGPVPAAPASPSARPERPEEPAMSDTTPHLGLPLIAASQAQKHVTHNEALGLLDALVQLACLDKDLTAPPPSPAEGDRYLVVAAEPGGRLGGPRGPGRALRRRRLDRRGAPGRLARLPDRRGRPLRVRRRRLDELPPRPSPPSRASSRLGINTGADADQPPRGQVGRGAAHLGRRDAGLRRHADLRQQAGAGPRRRPGLPDRLLGARAARAFWASDDFSLKVSPDGAAFATALTASATTGGIDFASTETVLAAAAHHRSRRHRHAAGPRHRRGTDHPLRHRGRPRAVRALRRRRDPGPRSRALALPTRADIVTAADDTCMAASDARRPLARAPLPARRRDAAGAGHAGARRRTATPGSPTASILQWGLATGADADVSVAFSPAFPSACLGVWAQPVAGMPGRSTPARSATCRRTGFTLRNRRARRRGDRRRECVDRLLAGVLGAMMPGIAASARRRRDA